MSAQPTGGFGALSQELLEVTWEHDPIGATRVGIHRYDDRLPDYHPDVMDGWGQTLRALRRRCETLDPATLDRDEQLDRLWMLAVVDRALVDHDLRLWERSPQFHLQGLGSGLHDLLIGKFAPPEDRWRSLLARLQAVPGYLDTAQRVLQPDAIPPIWIEYGLLAARSVQQFIDATVPTAALQVAVLEREVREAGHRAAQAIEEFQVFLRGIAGRASGMFAIGRDQFDTVLRHHHMLDMDADGLAEFGHEWIVRYETELTETARQVDPRQSWVEVLESIKDDHPAAADLRNAYEQETLLARRHCLEHDLITFPAQESCGLEWMPEFLRASSPIALPWTSPMFERGASSTWYITPVDLAAPPHRQQQHLRDSSWAWIRSIAMHEIYPGHHLHRVITKQVATPIRKQFWSPVFLEGWGLYTEELFYETGLLKDPRLRMMQLRNGLWRAVRVVVDTGLHTGGMSPEESTRWLVERARLEPGWAESETRLYTTRPTYPSAYLLGLSLILKLRDEYKARAGERFELKAFHDELMHYSTIPLKLVRRAMFDAAL